MRSAEYGWEDQLPTVRAKAQTEDIATAAHVYQPLGDLDDGAERTVWLRPSGQQRWCRVTAHLG